MGPSNEYENNLLQPYNDYITHDFPKEELEEILKICKELEIKWYCIVYDSHPE